jgi:hypothetical protein
VQGIGRREVNVAELILRALQINKKETKRKGPSWREKKTGCKASWIKEIE